jgi:hypothetical protein
MKFFSRYIKCFTCHKTVWTCNEVSIFNQHSSAVVILAICQQCFDSSLYGFAKTPVGFYYSTFV